MATLTLYSTPDCQQCKATARELDKHSVPYEYVDMSTDPEAVARVKSLGYLRAPVVETPSGKHWSGFRPDLIQQFVETLVPA